MVIIITGMRITVISQLFLYIYTKSYITQIMKRTFPMYHKKKYTQNAQQPHISSLERSHSIFTFISQTCLFHDHISWLPSIPTTKCKKAMKKESYFPVPVGRYMYFYLFLDEGQTTFRLKRSVFRQLYWWAIQKCILETPWPLFSFLSAIYACDPKKWKWST